MHASWTRAACTCVGCINPCLCTRWFNSCSQACWGVYLYVGFCDPEFHLFFQRLTNKAQSREGFSHWCSENQQILPRHCRLISPCCSLNFVSYFRRLLVVVGSWVSLRQPRMPFFPPVCTPQAEATDICLTGADKFTSITITRTAVPPKTMGGSGEPRLKD